MKTSGCEELSKAFWSYMTTAIPISSCFKSRTRSSNCALALSSLRLYTSLTRTIFLLDRPGDYLKPGEDDIDGLKRRLDDRLAPPTESRQFNASHGIDNDWEIGDCLAQWTRPNFETFMVSFHARIHFVVAVLMSCSILTTRRISRNQRRPKSSSSSKCLKRVSTILSDRLYFLTLSPEVLAVPKNMKLLAIPLFELYDNAARYALPEPSLPTAF